MGTLMTDTYFWHAFHITIDRVIVYSCFNVTFNINRRTTKRINGLEASNMQITFFWLVEGGMEDKLFEHSYIKDEGQYFLLSCRTAYAPSASLCTAIRCHWAGFGKLFAPTILWSNMPPVPTVKIVTVRPFLNIFWTGDCPTLPQIIACANPYQGVGKFFSQNKKH